MKCCDHWRKQWSSRNLHDLEIIFVLLRKSNRVFIFCFQKILSDLEPIKNSFNLLRMKWQTDVWWKPKSAQTFCKERLRWALNISSIWFCFSTPISAFHHHSCKCGLNARYNFGTKHRFWAPMKRPYKISWTSFAAQLFLDDLPPSKLNNGPSAGCFT